MRLALAEYINLRLITSKTESGEQGLKLNKLLSWLYFKKIIPDENRSGHGLTGRSGCYGPEYYVKAILSI